MYRINQEVTMYKVIYSTEVHPEHWETYHETSSLDAAISSYNACIHELRLIEDALRVRLVTPKDETYRSYRSENEQD